ncbi:heparinase II/III family protein [Planctomycetota bacterium]
MLLEDVTIAELAAMLGPHMGKPAWPGLTDPKAKARAKRWAKKLGVWDRVGETLDPARPIPVITRSDYRDYERTGRRTIGQAAFRDRLFETGNASLALWLGHPAADLDYLQDLLWAWCETTNWVWPAHERCAVDLGSSGIARVFAEILCMLDNVLEREVKERLGAEIDRRTLDPTYDWRRPESWATVRMNWNHVCNANIITTALYRIRDPRVLAAFIHPLIQRLDYAIDGFAADGGCLEGPGYWNYGFGHYVDAAVVLHHRTGGALDLMRGERIERICRYPIAAQIDGPVRSTFADSSPGYITADVVLAINRFLPMPELYEVADRDADGRLAVRDWRGLILYSGENATGKQDTRDYLLPDLGQAKLRAGSGKSATTLVVLAGRNDVPHNHNDIGSFIVYKHGACMLTDPGAPRYERKTFSSSRYEILFCRSRGHSAPLINGREQPAGGAYFGTLTVDGLNADGPKAATIDMTRAYDDKTLTRLVRRFVLAEDGTVTLTDTFAFRRKPRALEEAFITYEPVAVARGRRSVAIGSGRRKITVTCDTPGAFAADRLVEESKEGRTDRVVTRITFVPAVLSRDMTLAFTIR